MDRSEEPLIDGLDRLPEDVFDGPTAPDDVRERMLVLTTGMVRSRRRLLVVLRAAAAILIFAAGAVSGTLFRSDAPPATAPEIHVAAEPAEELPADPREFEARMAETDPAQRAEALRDAGDRYLDAAQADPESALYCYRKHLESLDGESAEPDAADGWLLTYLKLQDR